LQDKHSGNPRFDPKFEAGIVTDIKSEVTYVVHRHDRAKRKKITVNATLLRPRASPHPKDVDFPGKHDGPIDDLEDAVIPFNAEEELEDEFVQHVNSAYSTDLIGHLLPERAKRLPFWEAIQHINHAAVTDDDIVNLLLNGWITNMQVMHAGEDGEAEVHGQELETESKNEKLPDS